MKNKYDFIWVLTKGNEQVSIFNVQVFFFFFENCTKTGTQPIRRYCAICRGSVPSLVIAKDDVPRPSRRCQARRSTCPPGRGGGSKPRWRLQKTLYVGIAGAQGYEQLVSRLAEFGAFVCPFNCGGNRQPQQVGCYTQKSVHLK